MDIKLVHGESGRVTTALIDGVAFVPATSPGAVTITSAQAETLATRLGGGSLKDAADLLAKVARLAGIRFHNLQLDFTPNQLEELQWRAERQGKPVASLITEMARQFNDDWFTRSGGGEAMTVKAAGASTVATPPPVKPTTATVGQRPLATTIAGPAKK